MSLIELGENNRLGVWPLGLISPCFCIKHLGNRKVSLDNISQTTLVFDLCISSS